MPLDSNNQQSLSAKAIAARDASRAISIPYSNTGCTSGQNQPPQGGGAVCGTAPTTQQSKAPDGGTADQCAADAPQITPPPSDGKKSRKSRRKATSAATAEWLKHWSWDYASLTLPNGKTGTGIKRGHDYRDITAAAGHIDLAVREAAQWAVENERVRGCGEEDTGKEALCLFALGQGLVSTKIGGGGDGYKAGLWYAPTKDGEAFVMVRGSHPTNMPGLVISGGNGAGDPAIRAALDALPGCLAARLDVRWDHSRPGYLDDLLAYMERESAERGVAPPEITDKGKGITIKWGSKASGAIVRVYQKDLERLAKGRIEEADVDPDLVRVEFVFSPSSAKKAAVAEIGRQAGPGALLGTIKWVRKMTEHIGRLTGAAEDATIAVQRIKPTKEPLTLMQRAAQAVNASSRMMCLAVTSEIVQQRFDGDWIKAKIDEDEILREVNAMFARMMVANDAAVREHIRNGLDEVRTIEEEAERGVKAMQRMVERNEKASEAAKKAMLDAASKAGVRAQRAADEVDYIAGLQAEMDA